MAVEAEPTKHWCRKMRSVFRPWDVEAGLKGYVTLELFNKRALARLEKFPELGDEKSALERANRNWVDFMNCGVKMPEGYRLTEAQFIQNVWWFIHRPSFEDYLKEAAMSFMKAVDKDNKGYFTTEEAKQINSKLGREDPNMKRVFETLDEKKTGRVTFEQCLEAQRFFFYDTKEEDHPYNHVWSSG